MTTGGDPAALTQLAHPGPGQAFTLVHTARALERAGDRHRSRTPASRIHTGPAVTGLRMLADRIHALDAWVRDVAAALRAADSGSFHLHLLSLGVHHPAADRSVGGSRRRRLVPSLSAAQLEELAALPGLPSTWRDPVHRARLQRWLAELDERISDVPDDDVGLLARWADTWFLDPLTPVVDLHQPRTDTVARLRAEADGARRLLARHDLTVWSFDAGDPPTIRVALGDPGTATHLAVLLPGTASGIHAARRGLADATALHRRAVRIAGPGTRVATVLDLYAAPGDLGRAADASPAAVAGAATATFLADLPTRPRTTLVGHSYGALTAARASDEHPVDDLVLLGAPGVGVASRADLSGASGVWAARAGGDPIGLVADLDELLAALPDRWRPGTGPLADPLVAHGPDPVDPEFGARILPTAARGPGIAAPAARGHLDYLRPGTVALDNVARVVVGLPLGAAPAVAVRRGQPPRRDRRGSAGAG